MLKTPEELESDYKNADYINRTQSNRCDTETRKHRCLTTAANAGMDVKKDLLEKYNRASAQTLANICDVYKPEAVRAGSVDDKTDLPQFFRNQTGTEDPGDPEVVAEMAAARNPNRRAVNE